MDLRCGFDEKQLMFGIPMLINLYHVLFNFNPNLGLMNPEITRQRKAMVQLIMLFSEAVRFRRLRARLREIMVEIGQSIMLLEKM
ncbi:unnamed protein product [Urochloa humidicola]